MAVTIIEYKGTKLHYTERCYELYRIYPNGKEWFCGYFRSETDYNLELLTLYREPGPDEYVIKEIPSQGIPVWKIHDIVKERQQHAEEERKRAIEAKKLAEERKKLVEEWAREEREWREKHPGQARRLIDRRFPPLFDCHALPPVCSTPDGIQNALRFLYQKSTQKFVKATEFAKTMKSHKRKKR